MTSFALAASEVEVLLVVTSSSIQLEFHRRFFSSFSKITCRYRLLLFGSPNSSQAHTSQLPKQGKPLQPLLLKEQNMTFGQFKYKPLEVGFYPPFLLELILARSVEDRKSLLKVNS